MFLPLSECSACVSGIVIMCICARKKKLNSFFSLKPSGTSLRSLRYFNAFKSDYLCVVDKGLVFFSYCKMLTVMGMFWVWLFFFKPDIGLWETIHEPPFLTILPCTPY